MKSVAILAAFLAGAAMAAPAQEPSDVCLKIIIYPGMDCPKGTVRIYPSTLLILY